MQTTRTVDSDIKQAAKIGFICIFSYLTSYYMRNILSVSTPEMLETGLYSKEFLGSLSSTYMLFYAAGQLVNGCIGDKVASKYMVLGGLFLCGASSAAFPFCTLPAIRYVLFALIGFSLSMLRGPLVKTISENMKHSYARTCNVFLSFAGFAGPLIASVIAMVSGMWVATFVIAGVLSALIGVAAYLALSRLEACGAVKPTVPSGKKASFFGDIPRVFTLDKFIFYMIISIIVEISSISINFWLPAYFTERLGFDNDSANFVFSAIAFMRALMPFATLFLIKLFRENDVKLAAALSTLSGLLFVAAAFIGSRAANVALLMLALMCVSGMSAIVWSIYIPSLGKTGLVSTANGVLDSGGYFLASAANLAFSVAVEPLGWSGVVLLWAAVVFVGAISSAAVMLCKKSDKKTNNQKGSE